MTRINQSSLERLNSFDSQTPLLTNKPSSVLNDIKPQGKLDRIKQSVSSRLEALRTPSSSKTQLTAVKPYSVISDFTLTDAEAKEKYHLQMEKYNKEVIDDPDFGNTSGYTCKVYSRQEINNMFDRYRAEARANHANSESN